MHKLLQEVFFVYMTRQELVWVTTAFMNYKKREKRVDNLSFMADLTFRFRPFFSHLLWKVEQDNESIIFGSAFTKSRIEVIISKFNIIVFRTVIWSLCFISICLTIYFLIVVIVLIWLQNCTCQIHAYHQLS